VANTRSGSRHRPPGERFGRGFRSAGQTARHTLDHIAGKQGFAEPDILLRWVEIAGEGYASLCRPMKVKYGSNRAGGGTLLVYADSGRAPEVEHIAPKIIERVNQFYGYRAIARLKISQVSPTSGAGATSSASGSSASGFSEPSAPFDHAAGGDQKRYQTESSKLTETIQSPDLRAALTRMGTHVLAQTRSGGATDKDEI